MTLPLKRAHQRTFEDNVLHRLREWEKEKQRGGKWAFLADSAIRALRAKLGNRK